MMPTFRFMPTDYRKYRAKPRFSIFKTTLFLIIVVFTLVAGNALGTQSIYKEEVTVIEVIDGDTINVSDSEGKIITIRLLGIDTPETKHPNKPEGCYGQQASDFVDKNLFAKNVELEYDIEKYDKYDRTLAYVYLDGRRFNDEIVKQGYAKLMVFEPNTRYANELFVLELQARNKNLGLWGYCESTH